LLTVMYGVVIVASVIHKKSISSSPIVAFGIGLAGFITLQWLM
jgi:malic enzyme